MTYITSDWFKEQTTANSSQPQRYFLLDNEDLSFLVRQWPRIHREWNNLRPSNMSINLVYQKALAEKIGSGQLLHTPCEIRLGWTHPQNSLQFITLFHGRLERASISHDSIQLQAQDDISRITEHLLGGGEPLDLTNQNRLPSELVWLLLTEHGGVSALENNNNPDLDYTSFSEWHRLWQEQNIRMQAHFANVKLGDALRQLVTITHSAIYLQDNKLHFSHTTFRPAPAPRLPFKYITHLNAQTSPQSIRNHIWVHAGYSTQERQWAHIVEVKNDDSIGRFGEREMVLKSTSIWHTAPADAHYTAQRVLYTRSEPSTQLTVGSILAAALQQPGEIIYLDQVPDLGIDLSIPWRITSQEIDMERGTTRLNLLNTPPEASGLKLDDNFLGQMDAWEIRLA